MQLQVPTLAKFELLVQQKTKVRALVFRVYRAGAEGFTLMFLGVGSG